MDFRLTHSFNSRKNKIESDNAVLNSAMHDSWKITFYSKFNKYVVFWNDVFQYKNMEFDITKFT